MRSRGFVFSSPPAEFFAAHRKVSHFNFSSRENRFTYFCLYKIRDQESRGFDKGVNSVFLDIFQPTNAAGNSAGCHAEADHPELHRQLRLRPGAHGPVLHARPRLTQRLPRRLGERERSSETHHRPRGRRAPGGRAPQTGPGHLHSHVPAALSFGAADCLLHQLPAPKLIFRLYAIRQIPERGPDLLQVGWIPGRSLSLSKCDTCGE